MDERDFSRLGVPQQIRHLKSEIQQVAEQNRVQPDQIAAPDAAKLEALERRIDALELTVETAQTLKAEFAALQRRVDTFEQTITSLKAQRRGGR